MGIKISEYVNTVTSLSASDLTDVSKLISAGPNVWQTQKLPYSVLLTELAADLNFVDGSGTINYIPKFSGAGTIADGIMQDDGATISLGGALDATMKFRIYADKPFGLYVDNTAASGSQHISLYGKSIAANTASNTGFYGEALGSTGGTNLGARGKAANTTIQDSATDILYAGANTGGLFQANKSGAYVTYGLVGSADSTALEAASTHVGGFFRAINAGTKYAVRLVDGSEGTGKFLKSIDVNGNANWATVNDYTADATPDSAADYLLSWDASASLHKKVLMSNIPSSAVTIYGADATFSAARTAKLSGNTSVEYLQFQNLGGYDIMRLTGDRLVKLGTGSNCYFDTSPTVPILQFHNVSGSVIRMYDYYTGLLNAELGIGGGQGFLRLMYDATNGLELNGLTQSLIGMGGAGFGLTVGSARIASEVFGVTGSSILDGTVSMRKISTVTAASVTVDNHFTILCDCTSNAITLNLPAAAGTGVKGRIYNCKKIDATANAMTIDANASETIDGATTQATTTQWTNIRIQSNGTNWNII